jgi:hypothetical protein
MVENARIADSDFEIGGLAIVSTPDRPKDLIFTGKF